MDPSVRWHDGAEFSHVATNDRGVTASVARRLGAARRGDGGGNVAVIWP